MLLALGLLGCGDAGTRSGAQRPRRTRPGRQRPGSDPATPRDIETRSGSMAGRSLADMVGASHRRRLLRPRARLHPAAALVSAWTRGARARAAGGHRGRRRRAHRGRPRRAGSLVGAPTTTLEASEVVAQMLTFTQEHPRARSRRAAPARVRRHRRLPRPARPPHGDAPAGRHRGSRRQDPRALRGHRRGDPGLRAAHPDLARVAGFPAEKAGVKDGDLIVKIDGRSTVNMATVDAQQTAARTRRRRREGSGDPGGAVSRSGDHPREDPLAHRAAHPVAGRRGLRRAAGVPGGHHRAHGGGDQTHA